MESAFSLAKAMVAEWTQHCSCRCDAWAAQFENTTVHVLQELRAGLSMLAFLSGFWLSTLTAGKQTFRSNKQGYINLLGHELAPILTVGRGNIGSWLDDQL